MQRREFLKTSLAGAATPALPQSGRPERPNIVFFMMDQLSASWLWGPASRSISMPNFDRLRARGVTFDNAFASNPICCASRATLATGLSARGHGVLQNGYELDPSIPTFMQLLQKSGWHTAAIGKVHYKSMFHGVHHDYRPYGFDVVYNTEDARAGVWLDWILREHPEHLDAALATVWGTEIPELKAYGPQHLDLSARIKQIRPKHRWATPEFPQNTAGHYTLPFPAELSQTEWITRHAVEIIRQADRRAPLYAHISYVQPHGPSCPPGAYMKDVDTSRIPAPAPIEWVNDAQAPRCFPRTEAAHKVMPEDWRAKRHYYFADLAHLDRQLGEVTRALEESGRMDNTYIILISDHGELLFD
ncbi:MAG: sulfatase-like hydrolase/transferase, partial [Acidobacteria bacterium]|nr:sulfatase-like hydrolase/transferase [Acidobacteriota bacterium]